jgi:hypothetical protein
MVRRSTNSSVPPLRKWIAPVSLASPLTRALNESGIPREQRPHLLEIHTTHGIDESVRCVGRIRRAGQRFDMPLQLLPTVESVFARNDELGVDQQDFGSAKIPLTGARELRMKLTEAGERFGLSRFEC